MTSISIEMNNTHTDCDKGFIEIRCVVNGEFVTEISSISLNRIDANGSKKGKSLAEVSGNSLIRNLELSNRPGVIDTSFIKNVSFSYLSIKIMGSVVNSLKDKGPYQCILKRYDKTSGLIIEKSMPRMLNITGNGKVILCYMSRCTLFVNVKLKKKPPKQS